MRKLQHGGRRGAPILGPNGERVGAALNKSCILLLSALLQGYAEDVFVDVSRKILGSIATEEDIKRYRSTFRVWGNPSAENIERLFLRLGVSNLLDGLSWQRCSTDSIREKLREINELRNKVAHGKPLPESISLARVINLRNFVEQFSDRFARHARQRIKAP